MRRPGRATRFDACHCLAAGFNDHLRAASGYQVWGSHGRIGRVENHVYHANGQLEALTVRRGVVRRQRRRVSVSEIEWVLPFARRILLAHQGPSE